MQQYHQPVLIRQTLELLAPRAGGIYVDATVGGGGHSLEILKSIGLDGFLIGIDRDEQALDEAARALAEYKGSFTLVQGNFASLAAILAGAGVEQVDGVLFDFGVSSHQLDTSRGFSFMRDEPLDMRMSTSETVATAADIVNSYSQERLANIIYQYGEERYSRSIAAAIVEARQSGPIRTTGQLTTIIVRTVGSRYRGLDIHPATRTYQAIRIECNSELASIERALPDAIRALKIGGRIAAISFHSLEDRIAKNIFRFFAGRCQCPPRSPICGCGAEKILKIITSKPVVADSAELSSNPRSRSAKLRCAMKIA